MQAERSGYCLTGYLSGKTNTLLTPINVKISGTFHPFSFLKRIPRAIRLDQNTVDRLAIEIVILLLIIPFNTN